MHRLVKIWRKSIDSREKAPDSGNTILPLATKGCSGCFRYLDFQVYREFTLIPISLAT